MSHPSLWWWALPIVLLPILWHRQKREQNQTMPLASARFLPKAEPKQRRVWRLNDVILLLLRCLLLATLIALLADLVLAWRGDAVLVVPGTPPALVEREAALLKDAERVALPDADAVAWLHAHEREFKPDARLVVVGAAAMPATLPRFQHAVALHTNAPAAFTPVERHVAVFSERADAWRRLFAAANGAWRIVVDPQPGPRTELIVWDRAEAPPAALHAPLWWAVDARAFPALATAKPVVGLRQADSAQGRVWNADGWSPTDAGSAHTLFADWQRLHLGVPPYAAPPQALPAHAKALAGPASGALRNWLSIALLVLFGLERSVTHVRRR